MPVETFNGETPDKCDWYKYLDFINTSLVS